MSDLIAYESGLEVCGTAEDTASAIERIEKCKPDLVILDLSLKGGNGLELLEELKARNIEQLVLIVSFHDESIYAPRALKAGAAGYVMKQEATETLLSAIRTVLDGGVYLSPAMEHKVMPRLCQGKPALDPISGLSNRELEVFKLMGQGNASREIAQVLQVSLRTVESHRKHIRQKMGLGTATELVHLAIESECGPGPSPSQRIPPSGE
jgi:DNA-binding NarL/FixJ family response regulator